MGYPVLPNSILQVTFEGFLYGQQVMTVMSYRFAHNADVDGPTLQDQLSNEVNTAVTGLYAKWRACISDDLINVTQYIQVITPTRYAYRFLIPTVNHGDYAFVAGAPNIAAVVTRRTDLAGRDQISNLHLPGIPQEVYTAGVISDAPYLALLNAFVNESVVIYEPAVGGQLIPSAFKRSSPADSATLTNGFAHTTIRDMRRRTVGVGS